MTMNATERARRSDSLYYDTQVTNRRALCDMIAHLESDLAESKAENAKLRERALDLYCLAYPSTVEWEVADETYDKYSPCEKCHELHGGKSPCASTAKDMTEECCAPIQANVVADCLRELGVEVDG